MVKKSLFLFIAIALVVSGCLGSDGLDDEAEPRLTADVAEGEAPLDVSFSLDGGGADATWTLDLGDGESGQGTGLPSTYNHTYDEAGNHTVTLSIEGVEATADLVVTVTGSTGTVQEYSGGWMVTVPVYCALAGEVTDPLNGVFTEGIDVDAGTVGLDFTANFTSAVEPGIVDYLVHFVSTADGFTVIETYTSDPGEPATGTVPEDADAVYFSACGDSGPVEVDYRAG